MRTLNIVLMLCLAAIAALFCVFLLISSGDGLARSAAAASTLSSISIVSFAYFVLSMRSQKSSIKLQLLILVSYVISCISGGIAASQIGLVPYIMESMKLGFLDSLDYVWISVLFGGAIAVTPYIIAHIYTHREIASIDAG